MLRRKQAGDTIVEVLIAIVVISTILVGAFVVSHTSLKSVRNSEEHAQALNLLQSQIEQLRALTAGTMTAADKTTVTAVGGFCFDTAGALTGGTCALGTDSRYKITVVDKGTSATGTDTFESTVTWEAVTGSQGKEQLVYRLAIP